MTTGIAGHIGNRPETVREAVTQALRDFGLAYKRTPEESSAAQMIYERSLSEFPPEAIALGAQRAINEERFCPAPSTLRKYVQEEHLRIMRSRDAVIPMRNREPNGLACPTCGAEATWRNNRLVMEHDRQAHGIYGGPAA
jgi:hypothetical protein